jgi:hypothetical protein
MFRDRACATHITHYLPSDLDDFRILTVFHQFVIDGPSGSYDDEFGRSNRPPPRREEKVPDSVIEERIQRERPCRTLFIRNVKASRPQMM